MGLIAFFTFLAVCVVASNWRRKNIEAMKHQTMRLLIEKNQQLDQAQLAQLINPPPPPVPEWMRPKHEPGEGYKVLRIFGTIILFVALGFAIVACWRGIMLGFNHKSVLDIGTVIPILAMIGTGLFVASRYVTQPPSEESKYRQGQ